MTPDNLIADVARQLTDVDPPAGLRARVLANLDQPPSPRRFWWAPAVATAAAAVAIVALWPNPQAPTLPAPPSLAVSSAPLALDARGLTNDARSQSAPRSGIIAARRVNAAAIASAHDLEFRARAIPALDAPTPLALEAIQPQPLSIPLLVISPLSTTAATAGGDGGK